MRVGYLHIGPEHSGVRRYGSLLAAEARRRSELDVLEAEVDLSGEPRSDRDALRAACDKFAGADLVHFQHNKKAWGGGHRHFQNLSVFLRHCERPLLATLHDVYSSDDVTGQAPSASEYGRRFRRRFARFVDPGRRARRLLARRVALAVVHSVEESQRLDTAFRARQLRVLPHFVEDRTITDTVTEARNSLGLAGFRILTLLGFIVPRKGYTLVLDAVEELPDTVIIVFAGGATMGGQRWVDDLSHTIDKRGARSRVRLTGYLSEADLERYLIATDLAVCPFERFSASGSLSTWISVAKPILASNLPQIAEYNRFVPGAINTFHPYTPRALADGISRLLPTCSESDDPAVARLRERLSIGKIFNDYLAHYRNAID